MNYLVLLYADEADMPEPGTDEFDADMKGYDAFGELAGDAIVGGEALEPVATTRTVRHDDGVVQVTDGPFTETTEVLGGLFVLEAPTLDDTIELARYIPAVNQGAIEIRPMLQWHQAEGPSGEDHTVEAKGQRALVTLHGPETEAEQPGSPGWDAGAAEHAAFAEAAGDHLLASGAVHPSTTATTLRQRDGELQVTDGPVTEANKLVGGCYLLGYGDEEILRLARRVPLAPGGWAEVRPIMEIDG